MVAVETTRRQDHATPPEPPAGEPTGPGGPAGPTTTGDTGPPGLSALAVTAAGALYPAFAAGTRHYALTCSSSPTVTVYAATGRAGARLTLLRADRAASVVSDSGSLSASAAAVGGDHDLAIEVSDAGGSTTYVVHCLPDAFPTVRATRTGQAKAGLLLLTATYGVFSDHVTFMTVLDNNGVPRFHRQLTTASTDDDQFWALNFKYHGGGRFSVARRPQSARSQSVFGDWQIDLLDHRLQVTTSGIGTVAPLAHTDAHDFHVTAGGDYVMLSYDRSTRDFTPYGGSAATSTRDSVISAGPRPGCRSSPGTPGTIARRYRWATTAGSASIRTPTMYKDSRDACRNALCRALADRVVAHATATTGGAGIEHGGESVQGAPARPGGRR